MEIFRSANYNFIGNRNKAFMLSGALFLITIISLIYHPRRDHMGTKMSIDFAGGTLVQLKFEKPAIADLAKIRSSVDALGFGQAEVKTVGGQGDEIQIIVNKKAEGTLVGDEIKAALARDYAENPFELRREEKVGPKIGSELQQKALLAGALSLLAILVYIGIRFHLPFGIAAIVALFHDVIITIGIFSVFNMEISLPIIAALLTIIGYSLNDTIVVFDRIRENLGGTISRASFEDKVNASINQCLSRTIITSLTTLAVVVTIYAFFFTSGDVLKYFAVALIAGVIVGTYSSMFIASPVLVMWNKKWPLK
jgi:preprotein translocase subunit SecF